VNIHLDGAPGSPLQMGGGCQSCQGFQGQLLGGDMSPVVAGGAGNAARPESLDAPVATSVKTLRQRTKNVLDPTLHKASVRRTLKAKDR
jgi:hypothetical protein